MFGAGASAEPAVDVKTLQAKIGELALENDFLEFAPTSNDEAGTQQSTRT